MKPLTDQEIRFVKETGFTPTVFQCGEYYRTIFTKEKIDYNIPNYDQAEEEYIRKWYKVASDYAKEHYGIDLGEFIDKNLGAGINDSDGISLEYTATYLFYCFFTKEELEKLTDKEATKFLKDYRYYFGYRKWDTGNLIYVQEAIEAKDGNRVFYVDGEGDNVYNIEKEKFDAHHSDEEKLIGVEE